MISKLIKSILHNQLLIIAIGVLILAAGFYSYKQLPIEAFPDVSPSLVQVFTETEGLAPEDVEKYVSYPIETSMNGLPKIKKIRSVSNFGLSVVNIYFEDDTDIYFARQIVNERLQEARESIPEGFGNPQMGPIASGMGLVLFYYLHDDTGLKSIQELRTLQDWVVKFHLQTIPGVTEVLGIGGHVKQFHVVIKPEALLRYGITMDSLIEKIRANNQNVGAQFIEKNREQYIVRSIGLITEIDAIKNIIIKSEDGIPIFLKDVAEIQLGPAIRRGLQTRNGEEEVVSGMVIKLYGTNSSTIIEKVENKIKEINDILLQGVSIRPYYEQKSLIEKCVSTVTSALFQGIMLVILIIMAFIGSWRPSMVVVLSIPFSILFAMIAMKYFNITANLMSFGGLAIAIGMMVDGAIVIVENIDRKLHEPKEDPEQSNNKFKDVFSACVEVVQPITFAIFIIIVVFLPLFTLGGVEGKMFRPLAYTIAIAMLGSLIFAVFLAPILSKLLMVRSKSTKMSWIEKFSTEIYKPLVTKFIQNRKLAINLVIALVVIGALVFTRLGSEFTPTLQEGTLVLRLTMSPSISLEESKRVTMIVERNLTKIPEIDSVITRIGRGEVGAHSDPINSAEMYIILKDKKEWRKNQTIRNQEDLENLIRKELGEVPGVLLNFTQPIQMTIDELLEGIRADLAIKLFGDNLDVLKQKADEIAAAVRKVRGAEDVQVDQITGTPQLLISVNREAIARYGINVSDVQGVIRAAVGGETVGQVFEGIRRFDILVRFAPEYRDNLEAIREILIQAPTGVRVPLSELARIEEIIGPRQITRENSQRFIAVQCNVVGRDMGSFVKEAKEALKEQVKLPSGYLVTWGGQFRLQEEANKRLLVVVPITLLLILFLLYSNFHSIKNSFLIVLNIPLALVGGIVGLWLTGQNLSVPASVGFIALFGIALENGMVLVTYLNQLVSDGIPMDKASIDGACLRLRPVLMTAATTGLGLLPLLFSVGTGSEIQRPLAVVVLGGLITSTILTLLVIPAFYKWFAIDIKQKVEE